MPDIKVMFSAQGPEDQVQSLINAFAVINTCCRIGTQRKISLIVDGDGTGRVSLANSEGEPFSVSDLKLPEDEEFKFYIGE